MVTIGSALAQEIVERTMKIIPFSVNVMDSRGTIIASGNAARIGDIHPGAQLALAKNETVEIESAALPNLPGAKAGINLPLVVRGETCGVVGLTGEPDAVRQFGALVRLTAEMILEQAQLIGELQREKRYREEFSFQLVKKTGSLDAVGMEAWAMRLGLDMHQRRSVFVVKLVGADQRPDLALLELQRVQSELSARWPDLLTAVISPWELVLLEVFEVAGAQAAKAAARKRLEAIRASVEKTTTSPWVLSMGISLPGLDGAAASYEAAKKAARVGKLRTPEGKLFSYYELSLPVLLASLESGWQAEQLRQPLLQLEAFDRKSDTLLNTLAVWFAHNNHPTSTAKALNIHRNTLDYRLLKIGELTGLNLADTDDMLLLYVALQLRGRASEMAGD